TRAASTTATRAPVRFNSRAVVRPVIPPPMTATSTLRLPRRAAYSAACVVSSHNEPEDVVGRLIPEASQVQRVLIARLGDCVSRRARDSAPGQLDPHRQR